MNPVSPQNALEGPEQPRDRMNVVMPVYVRQRNAAAEESHDLERPFVPYGTNCRESRFCLTHFARESSAYIGDTSLEESWCTGQRVELRDIEVNPKRKASVGNDSPHRVLAQRSVGHDGRGADPGFVHQAENRIIHLRGETEIVRVDDQPHAVNAPRLNQMSVRYQLCIESYRGDLVSANG